jgi:hypothetical protein
MSDDLSARLAAAKARKSEAEAARAAAAVEGAPLAAAEAAERDAADAEALAKAEREIGKIGEKITTVETRLGLIILKQAPGPILKRFRDQGENSFDEVDKFVRVCLIHPDTSAYDRLTEELPGAVDHCGNAICALAGYRLDKLAGKS